MIDYEHLKNSYAYAVRTGMLAIKYEDAIQGNEILHAFCKMLVNSGDCTDSEKRTMNCDLDILKESLSEEIKSCFRKDTNYKV